MVDTGSELTWISHRHLEEIVVEPEKKTRRFIMANGQGNHPFHRICHHSCRRGTYNRRDCLRSGRRPSVAGCTHSGRTEREGGLSQQETCRIRSVDCRRQHAIRLSSRRRCAPEPHLQNHASASLTQPQPVRSCSRRTCRPKRLARRLAAHPGTSIWRM